MTLIVPALRLLMLALNVYDTYKVLKPPRVSARSRDGRPAERAFSQRKRKMKGCLAVWLVWYCYVAYESTVENLISLFIPFYDSCKSLVLLFLILTRARGAEPIFLHIIRPLLRPYTATLDAVADVGRIFGDVIFLLLAYPFRVAAEWWNTYWTPVEDSEPISHPISLQPGGGKRRSAVGDSPQHAAVSVTASLYQIWHPPRAAYEDDDDPPPMPVPQIPLETPEAQLARKEMEEWRQYPPIPSAYPPTPLPIRTSVPEPEPVISEEARKQMDEWRKYPAFPSAYPATPLSRPLPISATVSSSLAPPQFAPIMEEEDEEVSHQSSFGESLPSLPELLNPGSSRGASDMRGNALGIYEGEMDQDDDEDDSEDDEFDVTLRTPEPTTPRTTRSRTKRTEAISLSRLSSVSDSDPIAGRKRSRDLVSPAGSGEESASTSPTPSEAANPSALAELSASESDTEGVASAVEEESASDAELPATTVARPSKAGNSKRRKVVGEETPRRVQPRRGAQPQPPAKPRNNPNTASVAPNRTSSRIAAATDPTRPSTSRRGSKK
ncbi:hypothetical protein MIND_00789600 [Mycena indigotica]|uniref:Protein YOP1 n=1 Tax=Mycena indigotica TaxID=2126181 RepID=A0A8H6SMQ7_9AGAR|nr:uncharacterized protein MIND_00789600 [Mycena indigotica]KAF7302226.1 hypothetical protein MIND_00789600 [Mycena indigotica]